MDDIFTNIYENSLWGSNNNDNYNGSSGSGSSINYNRLYISFLKKFITDKNIKSVVDLGCGDFQCGSLIYDDLNISYTGYDIYNKVINYNQKKYSNYTFIQGNFYDNKETLKNADLCILKDVLQHWSLNYIYSFLDYIVENKKYKYILICNCCNQLKNNTDINIGSWHALNSQYLPLKKYSPVRLGFYNTKEVSLIIT